MGLGLAWEFGGGAGAVLNFGPKKNSLRSDIIFDPKFRTTPTPCRTFQVTPEFTMNSLRLTFRNNTPTTILITIPTLYPENPQYQSPIIFYGLFLRKH